MKLSKRLQAVANQVQSGGVVADIGCDHGFTLIYLLLEKKASAGIAMDIHDGPLQRVREHVKEHGLEGQIQIRKSDGTGNLQTGEADTIVISGIGGALMERILRERTEVTQSVGELVLSPQSEIYKVRHALHDLDFRIVSEDMVFDMGKYYTILRCERGEEHYSSEVEYTYGKCLIADRNPVFIRFLQKEKNKMETLLGSMPEQVPARKKLVGQAAQITALLEAMSA